jgi:hypothetical protein
MGFETPVAFLIFNRPDTTEKVFREIARVRPERLLVVADGARPDKPGEAEKCAAARAIIERVDWDCEVLKNYSDANLGCRLRVSSGLDWVFDIVEEAVILEDDCLPSPSFFPFCAELLARYRDDSRVMQICGSNFLKGWRRNEHSYYFSNYGPIWGWASWRRAWKLYDVEMKLWPELKEKRLLEDLCLNAGEVEQRRKIYDMVFSGEMDTWDLQWGFAKLVNSGLSITPSVNLVSNIGFGAGATHTSSDDHPFSAVKGQELAFPLSHPSFIMRDRLCDLKYINDFMLGKTRRGLKSILRGITGRL